MDRKGYVYVAVQPVPAELKARVRADAERRGTSLSDVAVEILAREFGVEFEAEAKPGWYESPSKNEQLLYLHMPPRLRVAIQRRAVSQGYGSRWTRVARSVLLDHYDLMPESSAA